MDYDFNLDGMTIGEYADLCAMDNSPQTLATARVIQVIARSTNAPVLDLPITQLRPIFAAFVAAVSTEIKLADHDQGSKNNGL